MALFSKKIENSPPGKIVRKTSKAATGGAALFIAFLAVMLFRNGVGNPDAGGKPSSNNNPAMATNATPDGLPASRQQEAKPAPAGTAGTELSDDERKAMSGKVLTVLIDERSYLLQIPTSGQPLYRPVTIERLRAIAPLSRGDENGIRVNILRRENARASAEEQLKLDLARCGISAKNIYMSEDFIP